ncbi:E3 ubiquitin-protein ligase RNF183 isoform X1 [Ictidomys tridecemlineatus]
MKRPKLPSAPCTHRRSKVIRGKPAAERARYPANETRPRQAGGRSLIAEHMLAGWHSGRRRGSKGAGKQGWGCSLLTALLKSPRLAGWPAVGLEDLSAGWLCSKNKAEGSQVCRPCGHAIEAQDRQPFCARKRFRPFEKRNEERGSPDDSLTLSMIQKGNRHPCLSRPGTSGLGRTAHNHADTWLPSSIGCHVPGVCGGKLGPQPPSRHLAALWPWHQAGALNRLQPGPPGSSRCCDLAAMETALGLVVRRQFPKALWIQERERPEPQALVSILPDPAAACTSPGGCLDGFPGQSRVGDPRDVECQGEAL